jgi:Fe-S oxidoreductase
MSEFMAPFGLYGYLLFWGLFIVAFGFFLAKVIVLVRTLLKGRAEPAKPGWAAGMAGKVLLQLCNLKSLKKSDLAGLGHALLFWGFGLFLVSYILFIGLGAGFGIWANVEGTTGWKVYASILDIFGILVIGAVIWAAVRRFIIRPARLKPGKQAAIILALVFTLMLLHFLSEGFSNVAGNWSGNWPPAGAALGNLVHGLAEASIDAGLQITWWLHYTLLLGFMVYIPYSKHLHILASPFNVVFRGSQLKGFIDTPDLEKEETASQDTASTLTRRQILDLYSCAECGRCHEACPAVMSGKALSPREQVLNLKNRLNSPLDTGQGLWDCVTCLACETVCPVDIRHVERMVDLRRDQVLMKAVFPAKIKQFCRNIEVNSNPWGKSWTYRGNWAEGLKVHNPSDNTPVNTVYWAGCLGAYDERTQRISTAIVRLLNAAGIRFSVPGKKEMCCGDAVRRTGNEYLYQQLARQNITMFKENGTRRIITNCPHCFHVFKNEYPQLGGDFEVVHHTQLLGALLQEGKIPTPQKQPDKTIIYHDPCYLGRYNGVTNTPRQILKTIPGFNVIEKNPTGKDTLCCGAGGGGMWMSETGEKRISRLLLDQVQEWRPNILATACPYCLTMLENESREGGTGNSLAVMDIAEILQSTLT